MNQLAENGDTSNTLEQIKKDVEDRDDKDANRDVSPLIKSEDAHLVDTSDLTTDETIQLLRDKVLAQEQKV